MRLSANVKTAVGKTRHSILDDGIVRELPVATRVEIVEEEPGYVFIYRYDANGQLLADTWHETVDAAKKQAEFEYGLEPEDWEETK